MGIGCTGERDIVRRYPMKKIRITVTGGKCSGDTHKVGQEFVFADTTPGGICLGAWNAIAPYLTALRYGANFPWEEKEGCVTIGCPEPDGGIVLQLERIEEGEEQGSGNRMSKS
jgi:uncharacterized repeat protein (TIGR04076 family)